MATAAKMSTEVKRDALWCLTKVVKHAWEAILDAARTQQIMDIGEHKGHDESTLDVIARGAIHNQLHRHFPDFEGRVVFESHEEHVGKPSEGASSLVLTFDEVDGTTNLKRALASQLIYPVSAAISVALGTSERLGEIQVSVVHALDNHVIYSAIHADDGGYLAFSDGVLLHPSDVIPVRGDSNARLLIPGYSFKERGYKAMVEESFMRAGLERVYEGSRSSAMDVIGIIRGLNDAYIDIRALFGDEEKHGAMLQGYDVAGVLPIALGVGLKIAAVKVDRSWEEHGNTERIALVVARPSVFQKVLDVVRQLPTPEEYLNVGEADLTDQPCQEQV